MTGPSLRRWIPTAALALLVGLAPACAREGAPPGGERDLVPPVVASTRPDTFQVLERLRDPIRIEFNERISERPTSGTLDDAVLVSPRTGEVRVEHKRDALEVHLSGGVRPGLVYRVTVLPVIQDMFSNALRGPFEFVFSTGGEMTPTAVAGLVLDRLTGQRVADARVIAREMGGDTAVVYTTRTDTSGIYALRYLPPGGYELVAFLDRDRNYRPGAFEVQGRREIELADTVISDLVVLEPDTIPALLASVEPTDSAVLTLTFDDYLDPALATSAVRVALQPDSTTPADAPAPPAVVGVFHPWTWQARLDSLAAAADTASEEGDDDEREPATGRDTPGGLLEGPLPRRELRVLLAGALEPEVPYRVTVEGIVNLAGLPGGGGSRIVIRREPVRRQERGDTATAPPDTLTAPPDTITAPPDTIAPPDTSGVTIPSPRAPWPSLRPFRPPP